VNYAIGGSASNGLDYQTLPGSVIIPANQASATILVAPIDDNAIEGDETVIVTLSANASYTVGSPSSATVTIADDDAPVVTIVASIANAAEPATNGQFTVSRTGSTAADLTVNYTVSGTATGGSDYVSLGTSVVIPAGSAMVAIPVTVIDDNTAEGNETVILTLAANASYSIGNPSSATVTIVDNDGPSISASPATVTRGSSVALTWSGVVTAAATDWIGLYTAGAANSTFWAWEYVSCTTSPTTARASGSCTLAIPINAPAGSFELRLFSSNTLNRLATSNPLTVQ
jgi:hypothetical protein